MTRRAIQAVRVSSRHPIVHAASAAITDETKPVCKALCGVHLSRYSLLKVDEPITCQRCVRMVES